MYNLTENVKWTRMTDDSSTKPIKSVLAEDRVGRVESEVGKGPVFTFFTILNRGEIGRLRTDE
ncbi:MAG: hypothetical protein DMG13_34395 [Acidobacteria bacterium]|nr:MAG: hypothetical protein DMG13_34395 [Acidobacteriota bacterium]